MAKRPEQEKLVTRKHLAKQEKERKQIHAIVIGGAVILALVLILVAYALLNQFIFAPRKTVARVGDAKISAHEFQSEVKFIRYTALNQAIQYANLGVEYGQMGSYFTSSAKKIVESLNDSKTYAKTVLDTMIDDRLIAEKAKELNITLTDEEVEKGIQEAFAFYPNGTPVPSATPTAVNTPTMSSEQIAIIKPTETPTPAPTLSPTQEEASKATATEAATQTPEATATSEATAEAKSSTPTAAPSITPTPTVYTTQVYAENVKGYVNSVKFLNISKADLEVAVRSQLLRDKVLEALTKDLKPEAEQVWVRHIIVKTEEEAQKVVDELNAGKDFAELAASYSTDGTKDNGGDLGWITESDPGWDKDFVKAAFQLTKVGEISPIVKTSFGYHIIQLVGRAVNPLGAQQFANLKQSTLSNWLDETKASRQDIVIEADWEKSIPQIPVVPSGLATAVYSTPIVH